MISFPIPHPPRTGPAQKAQKYKCRICSVPEYAAPVDRPSSGLNSTPWVFSSGYAVFWAWMEVRDGILGQGTYHVHSKMVGDKKEITWLIQLISKVTSRQDNCTHWSEEVLNTE
jgi:hypothetical protein